MLAAGLLSPARLVESARILQDIEAGDATGLPPVRRRAVSYEPRGEKRTGDLYRERDPLAGLVLAPGAALLGKDDPRLVSFAQALARARFEVLVPDLPGLQGLQVGAGDADIIPDALSVLAQHRAAQGNATVGMISICYSTGPAMIALLDRRVRGSAQFMLAIGGYCDIASVIRFMTTGNYANPRDNAARYRLPDEYAKWIFALSSTSALESDRDRELLESMAQRRLGDRTADLSDLAAGLGDEGRRVYALLENRDPERVAELIGALPGNIREEIAGLDLSRRDFSQLDMRFTLIHGTDDDIIPETESVALAATLPDADVFILNSIQHVDPGPAGLGDKLKLMAAVHGLLRQRDRVRRPDTPVRESPLRSQDGSHGAG
jgi:pimeloyl-ACP methyl ester carboxylesterase